MIPLIVTGALVLGAILCAMLSRALWERDQARIALGIARMELLDVRLRLQDTHRRVIELERQADRPAASDNPADRVRVGHPLLGRSIPGGGL